jgi:DNA topoisomerase-1
MPRSPKRGRQLVIVESPAKARTINRILGTRYAVKSCMGHVRDLPQRKFGIDLDNGFEPSYVPVRAKAKTVRELRQAMRGAPAVYLAPDPDREGEAIAWHLAALLKLPPERTFRVTFNEITRPAVLAAFERPTSISMPLVEAQQARRLLDRIVGYKLSPLLWKKIGKGLSAGRVQSVAVRLIVEREREIRAFEPREYWTMTARLRGADGAAFEAALAGWGGRTMEGFRKRGEPPPLGSAPEAEAAREALRGAAFVVAAVQEKDRVEKPPSPFTTSLLQQQAATRLGMSTHRTMSVAQQLYEGIDVAGEGEVGLITYMRTDSFRVAAEAVEEMRRRIRDQFGPDYLPAQPPKPRGGGKHAQEAHEAIRPTHMEYEPRAVRASLTDEQARLYTLIWNRFMASQMAAARFHQTEIKIEAGAALFHAGGRRMLFDGFTRVLATRTGAEEQPIPRLRAGEALRLEELSIGRHFTEPPPRYSEASLVKALEKFGIGRPSTYAPIISTIQQRGYVQQIDRRLHPTELGAMVTEKLVEHFGDIINTDFTSQMEKELDAIEEGRVAWAKVLGEFWTPFKADLDKAALTMQSQKGLRPAQEVACDKCGKPMLIRWNRHGKFLGCSGFPECRNARPLLEEDPSLGKCPRCGQGLTLRRQPWGSMILCTRYPGCATSFPREVRRRRLDVPVPYEEPCPECRAPLTIKYGRRGPFIACSGYPACTYTKNLPKEWFHTPPGTASA